MTIATQLECEECGAITVVPGYASVGRCGSCQRPTATIWEHTLTANGVTTSVRPGSVVKV